MRFFSKQIDDCNVNEETTMSNQEKKVCFCTLALGNKYRALASLLAKDIDKYAPHTSFVILTDNPNEFSNFSQVLAFKHQQHGVKCYHDKRFVIAQALSLFDSCIFLDADMRILASVPEDIQWLNEPGITARACFNLPIKFAKVIAGTAEAKYCREFKIVKSAIQKLNLDAEWENIKFVQEYLFAITKDSGKEIQFLRLWEILANYFERNGLYDAEGNAIGLAAYKAGFPVRWGEMPGLSFFNEKIERFRIQKGQSSMDEMSIYFEEHARIAYPKRSILEKLVSKIGESIKYFYRLLRLKIVTN